MVPNSRVVVDSSVLVAFYLKADSQHEKAATILSDLSEATLILHPFVVQETATVIAYKSGRTLAGKFLRDIQQAKNIQLAPIDLSSDMAAFLKMTRTVSFTDIAIVVLACREQAQLLTFDQQVSKIARTFKSV